MSPLALRLMACLGFALAQPAGAADHQSTPPIWFSPDDETPDLLDLFSRPYEWPVARSHLGVLKLGPQHFETHPQLKINTLADLAGVSAFEKLKAWGIALASEEGAVKEWDCTGKAAADVTLGHLRNVRALHGEIRVIAMDEPLVSGLGPCALSVQEVAGRTGLYVERVRQMSRNGAASGTPLIGDIEPYPFFSVSQLGAWLDALDAAKVRLEFFHLDIDMNALKDRPGINAVHDVRQLQWMLRKRHVPFGVIIWSGRDPEASDEAYYRDAMRLVRLVKASTDTPRQVIFQSWVRRAASGCSADQADFCSGKSIPLNLPEAGPLNFSHTRLLNDAIAILHGP